MGMTKIVAAILGAAILAAAIVIGIDAGKDTVD